MGYIIAVLFVVIMFWIGLGRGKKEAKENKFNELGVGKDFESFGTDASNDLGWVVGFCKRKGIEPSQQLMAPLMTPTLERAFDHVQFVTDKIKRMDKNPDFHVSYSEQDSMIRLASEWTQEVLVVNTDLLFIWFFDVSKNTGKFVFVGPFDGSNRIDILPSQENPENYHLEVVGDKKYLQYMSDEKVQAHLTPALDDMCGYDFYMSTKKEAARPNMGEIEVFCGRAKELSLAISGPTKVFTDDGSPALPQSELEQLYARAYRLASGAEIP